MRLETCYFCSSNVYPGHGSTFVRNDAKVFHFCRSKCRRNFDMKRNPRKVAWTKSFRKTHGKELTDDALSGFERKRNRTVKYDRELMSNTLTAMKRVQEIKSQREKRFQAARIKGAKVEQARADRKELKEGINLLPVPVDQKAVIVRQLEVKERLAEPNAMAEDA